MLGGLIGLAGAEFRLPMLAGVLGYKARRAVALNLAISLITVVSTLLIRGATLSLVPLVALLKLEPCGGGRDALPRLPSLWLVTQELVGVAGGLVDRDRCGERQPREE